MSLRQSTVCRLFTALLLTLAAASSVKAQWRVAEKLDRGLVVMAEKDHRYLSWRLLESDPAAVAFDVYRHVGDKSQKLNAEPITKTTDFVDKSPLPGDAGATYSVRAIADGKTLNESAKAPITPRYDDDELPHLRVKLDGDHLFQKVGIADLDGDGRLDFVIKQPEKNIDPWHKYWYKSPDTYKLEAYTLDGKMLWRYDLGWAIERGIWYSPYIVFDLDGDGKAEVIAKTGQGDPRDSDGRVTSGPEYLTVLNGQTGKPITRADWPDRADFYEIGKDRGYNYASRNQIMVAYLDGKTPHLLVERGTYNLIIVDAYRFDGKTLQHVWRWNNRDLDRKFWGQGAHWMHAADVDADGCDEVIIGSAVLDEDGKALWSTGLGHPDHSYVGDLDPKRPGLEIYYGIESRQKERNGMCMVDAATGKILWGYEGFTRHVHSQGMCSDIDARYPGWEAYSCDTDAQKKPDWALMHAADGTVIGKDKTWKFGTRAAWWDADAQREVVFRNHVTDYPDGKDHGRVEGRIVAIADVVGDWREEIICSMNGMIRIYTTTEPAADRRVTLMRDPIYRMDVAAAAMGYYQDPCLSRDLSALKR
ncbi:silent information regulator protein Sir2 [Planctomycetales bacterium ZRK34]|nr:silent information regulator protein Sir2 [Planctomycetales bacterium ZRK34]